MGGPIWSLTAQQHLHIFYDVHYFMQYMPVIVESIDVSDGRALPIVGHHIQKSVTIWHSDSHPSRSQSHPMSVDELGRFGPVRVSESEWELQWR
jgi:hypothetical protein